MYNQQNNPNKWRGNTPWAQGQHGQEQDRDQHHLIRISSRQSQHDHDLRVPRNVFGHPIDHHHQYQRSVEHSRSTSYTEGFGTPPEEDDDDEPNDVLVWNTQGQPPCQSQGQCQYRRVLSQRSLSDTDDRIYIPSGKVTLTKSRVSQSSSFVVSNFLLNFSI